MGQVRLDTDNINLAYVKISLMLKKVNFLLSSFLPQKLYWYLAGLIHPWEAAIEEVNNPELFYKQSKDLVKLLEKLQVIDKKTRVLDIGCGVGRLEYALAEKVGQCTGIDISPSMVKLAKRHVKGENVKFLVTNGKDLEAVKNQKFDLVFSILVFQHLPREFFLKYLQEINSVLKKEGKLLFQIPIYWKQKPEEPPKNHPWGLRFYSLKELQESLERLNFSEIKFFDVGGGKLSEKENQAFVLAAKNKK